MMLKLLPVLLLLFPGAFGDWSVGDSWARFNASFADNDSTASTRPQRAVIVIDSMPCGDEPVKAVKAPRPAPKPHRRTAHKAVYILPRPRYRPTPPLRVATAKPSIRKPLVRRVVIRRRVPAPLVQHVRLCPRVKTLAVAPTEGPIDTTLVPGWVPGLAPPELPMTPVTPVSVPQPITPIGGMPGGGGGSFWPGIGGVAVIPAIFASFTGHHHGTGGGGDFPFSPTPPVNPPNAPNTPPTTVPEPATLALMATGLVGLAGAARRRRKR